jgi:hypothetical protein
MRFKGFILKWICPLNENLPQWQLHTCEECFCELAYLVEDERPGVFSLREIINHLFNPESLVA